jgi:hypothetical protein
MGYAKFTSLLLLATLPLTAQVQMSTRTISDWNKGVCVEVTLYNDGNTPTDWKVDFKPAGKITQMWNANYTQDASTLAVVATGVNWNKTLQPHQQTKFGYCSTKESPATQTPTSAGLEVEENTFSQWNTGLCRNVSVINNGSEEVLWRVTITPPGKIDKMWNAKYSVDGEKVAVEGVDWNKIVKPHSKVEFGYCVSFNSTQPSADSSSTTASTDSTTSTTSTSTATETASNSSGTTDGDATTTQPTATTDSGTTDTSSTTATTSTSTDSSSTTATSDTQTPSTFGVTNYQEVLPLALQFYEAQRGPGPFTKVTWRKPAVQDDGKDVGRDLSKGWFDAGDHVKFNLPMSYSATMLAWGMLEFPDAYQLTNSLEYGKDQVKYALDYFLNCYNGGADPDSPADDIVYYQVGDPYKDHAFWGPPELMTMERPTYSCDANNRCTEVSAGMAAALASGSILFKTSDPVYSQKLLDTAKKIYKFAETYQGNNGYTAANGFYSSYSGYNDELAWGAVWLYKATGDPTYLQKAETYIKNAQSATYWAQNWDNVSIGTYLLLYQITHNPDYKAQLDQHMDYWLHKIPTTEGGLAFLSQWGSLRYASTTAYIALVYAKYLPLTDPNRQSYIDFAKREIDYILGDNPRHSSYVVGYGQNYPINPHHRASHDSHTNNIDDPVNNHYLLVGALVGGPKSANDFDYKDDRHDYVANEVATDYNAGFTGALAGLIQLLK